ncbi:MAG: glycosyltransferase family 4 protein [Saprospiraceae bacterium]|nr:glycosyltransferase family 4 protein [Saprospiraceae bacterium]
MNILLLNTYPHGGAGTACRRLQAALQESGQTATLLSADQVPGKWPFYAERLSFLPYERDKSVRFSFSLANFGHDISQHPAVQAADVLHLHWINQGFLSLKNIRQLAETGKPVVWTLHDMWVFTGGCHYSGECRAYRQACGHCPYLRRPGVGDLSQRIWSNKKRLFPKNIHFVTCSDWLAEEARSSGLLRDYPVHSIPNSIDTEVFKPALPEARAQLRRQQGIAPEALVVLFVAMKVREERKGFSYLLDALQRLKSSHPELPVEILVMGQSAPEDLSRLPYPAHSLGMLRDPLEIASAYGAADVFVIPSLEDNLPNTVMEALACGTPVVGFQTGGIPQMVEHLAQGYIAPQRDSEALAAGLQWVLQGPIPLAELRAAAREKVSRHYANNVVAARYLDLYRQVLGLQ